MRIKPAAGLKVRDHITRQLIPEEGIEIVATDGMAHDPYWRERLSHGDVEIVTAKPVAIAAPAAAPDPAPAEAITDIPEADPSAHGS